jgi:hypothetical protein
MSPIALMALAASSLSPATLYEAWPSARFVGLNAPCLRHADLVERLTALERKHKGRVNLEPIGASVEGRAIHLLSVGGGPRRVLLWSQMHGDEPSATPALLDLADYLLSRPDDAAAKRLLDGLTLLMIPMLNPDGAERYERRNAQGIDINRDALNLATPEGRLLKSIRDRHQPELGFNLHDQNRRATVGDAGTLATISVLAVSGDARGTLTPGRERTRRVCSAIAENLQAFIPGGVGRYDEDWSPRAFGDNLTAWGTPIVLIESGGQPPARPLSELTRLNFVALGASLDELVRDDLAVRGPEAYERLPRNGRDVWADVVLRGGYLLQPGLASPYRADVAFDLLDGDLSAAGCRDARRRGSRIVEVGDARFLSAGRAVDATGALLAPGLTASVSGLAARSWLGGSSLVGLARLGVTRLRWCVAPAESAEAAAFTRTLPGDDAPAVVVAAGEAPSWIELQGPPSATGPTTLADALTALGGASWRERASALALSDLLARLSETGSTRSSAARGLRVEIPASFLVLRPEADRAPSPDTLRLEAVYLDGHEVKR